MPRSYIAWDVATGVGNRKSLSYHSQKLEAPSTLDYLGGEKDSNSHSFASNTFLLEANAWPPSTDLLN
jgi:hypothetical protein